MDGLRIDWHCHSTWSDGHGTVAQLARQARQRGVTLGISDHGLRDNRRLRTAEHLAAYLEDLTRHRVLRGIEISVGDLADWGGGAGILDQFDYVIASQHTTPVPEGIVSAVRYQNYRAGLYPGYVPSVDRYARTTYFEAWLRNLEATARRWPVTILGHFCLLPELANEEGPYVLAEDPEPDEAAAAWQEATIQLCLRYGIAVELNSKSRVPHAGFVRRALEMGARFSLGSDAHQLRRAGDLAYGRQLVQRLGIPRDRLLGPGDVRPVPAAAAAAASSAAG